MSWRNHKDTIVTNVVQQSTAILIFLVVPNLLPVESYGQVVFVGTLLSFMGFADLGLSLVYGRKMPAIYANSDGHEVRAWNQTVFTFRLYTAAVFGMVISVIYWLKYQIVLNTLLLYLIPLLSVIPSFYIAQKTALADFSIYRKTNNFQSIARLLAIPGVMASGVLGWFFSQIAANLLTIFKMPRKYWWPEKFKIDLNILKMNLFEGVQLGAIATLWTQLLASGRVFSSLMYPDTVVAQYGLMNTGYQIVGALIISAFLPQTVKVYKMMEVSPKAAIEYTFKTVLYAIPVVFALTVISREAAPYVLEYFFPKYDIDPIILDGLIFSLAVYPLLVTLGSVLVAQKKTIAYLFLLASALVLNWILINGAEPIYGYGAAAVAQLATLVIYSALLLTLIYYLFWKEIDHKTSNFIKIYGCLLSLYAPYLFVRDRLF